MKKQVYLVSQFCDLYSISRETLYKEAAAGRIRIFKHGRRTLVSHTDALIWLNNLPLHPKCKAEPLAQPPRKRSVRRKKTRWQLCRFFKRLFRKQKRGGVQ